VKYCSTDCQKNHRKQHKKACKKRLAEIRDDQLFTQPDEVHFGECPLCCLSLPLDENKSSVNSCCCKRICKGCSHANTLREEELSQYPKCPFCREPLPKTQEEIGKNVMKRVKANDPVALRAKGVMCRNDGDYEGAVEYYTKAADLGDIEAHYNLSLMYQKGEGVEKDKKKEMHHLEEAAIGGHPSARYNLGCHEGNAGRIGRSTKHFIIAANLGYDDALEEVKNFFTLELVSKEEYEAALRGHQAAVDATKSHQRDAAEEYYEKSGRRGYITITRK
jgi:tetratricopeptide (TPR) repeat protein